MRSSPFSLTTRISVTPNVSTPDRQDGLYSSHGSISPSPIVHATRSLRQMLYPIKIPPKSAPKSLSPSCLPNSLSVPFSGPSTNRSFPPMLPSHLRRSVLPATPTFPELNAITSYTLLIPLWALAIQGPTAPSQYCKIASGGPIWPEMLEGTSRDVKTAPSPKAHAIFHLENFFPCPYHRALGHT